MRRTPALALALVAFGLLAASLASVADARTAYVGGADQNTAAPYVVPVNLATQSPGSQIPLPGGGEGASQRLAITPDGATVWAPNLSADNVVPIAVATNTAGTPVNLPGGTGPSAIAIAPDGSAVYVTGEGTDNLTRINTATNTVAGTIPVGSAPIGIAITPDGRRAYVVNNVDGNVTPINLATDTPGTVIPVAFDPDGIAISPDGRSAYVTSLADDSVTVIDIATNTVSTTITGVDGNPDAIAITPDGSKAYAVGAGATPISIPANTAGAQIPIGDYLTDVAILPSGSTAYPVDTGNPPQGLTPLDVATDTPGSEFGVGSQPDAIAIVPNQPPQAAFSFSPSAPTNGASVGFDGSGSSDSDGTVARYDWDFGDGTSAADAGRSPNHTYAKPGTYQVTLTTTDNEGCSTHLVFTGQTAYCNGSSVASITHPVTVASVCEKVSAGSTSFVPKFRLGHTTVPGVRVRLHVSHPAHLDVQATLDYSSDGPRYSGLGSLSVQVKHFRRVRFAIPNSLRDILPVGTPVKVKLKIHATPTPGTGCPATSSHRTLHVKVVRVLPNAVQKGRQS